MLFTDYRHLAFERRPHGVLSVALDRPEVLNAIDDALHAELVAVWRTIGADPSVRCVVLTGRGRAFSVGADPAMVEANASDPKRLAAVHRASVAMVQGLLDLAPPVVSAVHGVAAGAGLALALLADVSLVTPTARLTDGHTRVGVAAGDHGALLWPLLCGMARAKYHLLLSDFVSGREAERIGLVSRCVPADRLSDEAFAIARRLALGPRAAIEATKRSLNLWLRQAAPIFEQSLALEMLTFLDEDALEGARALREKRAPRFPSSEGQG
jgi:enoyl-CoA hydratase